MYISLNSISLLPEIFDFDSKKPEKAVRPDAEDFSCLSHKQSFYPYSSLTKVTLLYECYQKPLESCRRFRAKSKTMNLQSMKYIAVFLMENKILK